MKKLRTNCLNCGSKAINTLVDEMSPSFRMEIVGFACGAVLKSSYTVNGRIGKVSHTGCGCELTGFGK